jgi:1,4-alpha-glucan branching enzyme
LKQIGSSENLKDFTTEKNKKKRKSSAKTKVEKFSRINPLKNATSLLKFYRNFLKANNSKIVFCNFESEISHAGEILDEVNKGDCDERFLRSWMSYFIETKLKGENFRNQYKTSIGELKKTYCDYKVRYIG